MFLSMFLRVLSYIGAVYLVFHVLDYHLHWGTLGFIVASIVLVVIKWQLFDRISISRGKPSTLIMIAWMIFMVVLSVRDFMSANFFSAMVFAVYAIITLIAFIRTFFVDYYVGIDTRPPGQAAIYDFFLNRMKK